MPFKNLLTVAILLIATLEVSAFASVFHNRKKQSTPAGQAAEVFVKAGIPQCRVDVDGQQAGMTGAAGTLTIQPIEPGEHYLHVACPGREEVSRFITSMRGQKLKIKVTPLALGAPMPHASGLSAAESKMRLRRIVRQAVQLRAGGQLWQAVKLLREAILLDPRNADLHREIGITFLLNHDWKQARVEMLEAVHQDPDSAEAHSGLAYADEKLGNLHEALKQYRICTRLDPDDASYGRHYIEVLGDLYGREARHKQH